MSACATTVGLAWPGRPRAPGRPWPGRRAWWLLAWATLSLFWPWSSSQAWDAERMKLAAAALGPRAESAARELQQLLPGWSTIEVLSRLDAVNAHFNRRVAFADDDMVWHQGDYWASPLEMLSRGEGDCEDFAIAKYFTLIAIGVPVARLRLVYVRAQLAAQGGQGARTMPHMVLAYFADAGQDPLVLDNLVAEIRPASRRPDLTPVFSFNTEGLWQEAGTVAAGDPLARLSRWREVVNKARAEGFQCCARGLP